MPGPHFLHLLESVPLEVSKTPFGTSKASTSIGGEKPFALFYRFSDEEFENFMNIFNYNLVDVRHGKIQRTAEGFSRELIWYLGIEKFVFEERGR
jgi:hypothetical protein